MFIRKLNQINEQLNRFMIQNNQMIQNEKSLNDDLNNHIKTLHQNEKKAIERLHHLKEEVLVFYRIAKENSRKEYMTLGVSPARPDIERLNRMVYEINTNNHNDPVAGKVIDLISSYLAYIEQEVKKEQEKTQQYIYRYEKEQKEKSQFINKQRFNIKRDIEQYLSGNDVYELKAMFDKMDSECSYDVNTLRNWDGSPSQAPNICYGYQKIKLHVPKKQEKILKKILGPHVDGNQVDCPCTFDLRKKFRMTVEYHSVNEKECREGVQTILINLMRHYPMLRLRINVFDSIHYNGYILGSLSALTMFKKSIFEPPAENKQDMQNKFADLAVYYQKLEKKLGTESVREYNRNPENKDKISKRILILVHDDKGVQTDFQSAALSYLIHNSEKLGIMVLELICHISKENENMYRDVSLLPDSYDKICITYDDRGSFQIRTGNQYEKFYWKKGAETVPEELLKRIENLVRPKEIGTEYFKRYPMTSPKRSEGQRKEIRIPFAIDENDKPIWCSFENEMFAAYMMGASRSGKSTLLHTLIAGLMMNYHPDELELWMIDFKMTEFRKYADYRPPHIKYLLLDDSEQLLFDFIDELTSVMNYRQKLFARKGWSKHSEVPVSEYMPVIFVIMDEFAQVSQKLLNTRGSNSDYTLKLENLLAKGGAFGLKFIFASQSYSTGVAGLTETARKQIQTRFALKNTAMEIKETLAINSVQIDERISREIASLQVYQTMYKTLADDVDMPIILRVRNLYFSENDMAQMIHNINKMLRPVRSGSDEHSYLHKDSVYILDDKPHTFSSMIPYYKNFERNIYKEKDYIEYEPEEDYLIYPGVPCSFRLAKPMILKSSSRQNILAVGCNRDAQANLFRSFVNSWMKTDKNLERLEIWAHGQSPVYRKYKKKWSELNCYTTEKEIQSRMDILLDQIHNKKEAPRFVLVMGTELLLEDLEEYDHWQKKNADQAIDDESNKKNTGSESEIDIMAMLMSDEWETISKADITKYNEDVGKVESQNRNKVSSLRESDRNSRDDFMELIKYGAKKGIYFGLAFTNAKDFTNLKIDQSYFVHKILYPMTIEESVAVANNRIAAELPEDTFCYSDGYHITMMRNHIYPGIPCGGWVMNDGHIEKIE